MTDILHMISLPLLRELQRSDPRADRIASNVRRSGARTSTLIIMGVNALGLGTGAVLAASIVDQVSLPMTLVCAAGVFLATGSTGRFRTRMVPDFVGQLGKVALSVLLGSAVPFFVVALFGGAMQSVRSFVGVVAVLFLASVLADWIAAAAIRHLWASGRLRSRAVILGSGRLATELAVELQVRPEYGVDLVEVVDQAGEGGLTERLIDAFDTANADRLMVAPLDSSRAGGADLVTAVRAALGLGIPTFVVPRLYEMGLGLDSMSPDRARGYPLVRVQRSAHPSIALRLKRLVDIIVSGTVLILISPLLGLATAAIWISGGGPVLFRQRRVGQHGCEFEILKLRSMSPSPNEHGERSSGHRVTGVGRVLRATSVDELPQLWNIFKGDMSLVGARPERVAFVEQGLGHVAGYAERHRMPMGLTGLAQVAGLRGEETSVEERVKFDNLYIDQWSLMLDVEIVLKTAFAVLFQRRYRRREVELEQAIDDLPAEIGVRRLIDRTQDRAS